MDAARIGMIRFAGHRLTTPNASDILQSNDTLIDERAECGFSKPTFQYGNLFNPGTRLKLLRFLQALRGASRLMASPSSAGEDPTGWHEARPID
jgi:hypothetical protein